MDLLRCRRHRRRRPQSSSGAIVLLVMPALDHEEKDRRFGLLWWAMEVGRKVVACSPAGALFVAASLAAPVALQGTISQALCTWSQTTIGAEAQIYRVIYTSLQLAHSDSSPAIRVARSYDLGRCLRTVPSLPSVAPTTNAQMVALFATNE